MLYRYTSVPAPWLSAYSQTPPYARAGGSPPVAPVLWCCGSCLHWRMYVYCLKISCDGCVRRGGGGGDCTANYTTWECWKQLMPQATGDMPDAFTVMVYIEPWRSMETFKFCNRSATAEQLRGWQAFTGFFFFSCCGVGKPSWSYIIMRSQLEV